MELVAYNEPKAPFAMWPLRREQNMTAHSDVSTLKYEETEVSLGDQLRAARAARGLSIPDVEADLRIKSYYIEAIEAGDLSALPDKVYVDGFVRNYASYLQLDPEETLSRFDEETGFSKPNAKGRSRAGERKAVAAGNPLAGYTPPRRTSSGTGGGLGRGLAALWPLVVLAGLGYAIWYGVIAAREAGIIPDNLSVIGATEVEPPVFTANISDDAIDGEPGDGTIERPADLAYARPGTLPYWSPQDAEAAEEADGPVSTIDIASVGLFSAHRNALGVNEFVRDADPIDMTPAPPVQVAEIAAETRAALLSSVVDGIEAAPETAIAASGHTHALVALEETWIEVKAPSGRVRFSGILAPGEAFEIPADGALSLKVGNAGGLVAELDGRRYGPFGKRGAVLRNVALDRQALLDRFGTLAVDAAGE